MKSIVTVLLLVFVAASTAYLAIGERRSPGKQTIEAEAADAPGGTTTRVGASDGLATQAAAEPAHSAMPSTNVRSERRVIAYYFHRAQRCRTCLTMEAYAEQALKEGLSDAMESRALEWHAVNVEEPENEHFVTDYELYASALVMVDMQGVEVKRSKKLEQIWDLVGDEWKFKTFVRDEALAYLEDVP